MMVHLSSKLHNKSASQSMESPLLAQDIRAEEKEART